MSMEQMVNFDLICRLCLAEKRGMSSIFSKAKTTSQVPLHQRIMSCASVLIFEGDGLPAQICNKCLQAVNQSFALKGQVEEADSQLRQMLQRMNEQNETEETNTTEGLRPEEVMIAEDEGGQTESNQHFVHTPEVLITEVSQEDRHPGIKFVVVKPDKNRKVQKYEQLLAKLSKNPGIKISKRVFNDGEKSPNKNSIVKPTVRRQGRGITGTPKRRRDNVNVDSELGKYNNYHKKLFAELEDQRRKQLAKDENNYHEELFKEVERERKEKFAKDPKNDFDPTVLFEALDRDKEEILERRATINKTAQECGLKTEGDKIFCKVCKIFIRRPYFYNHIKYAKQHADVRDHLCQECGYRTSTRYILKQHMEAVHSGVRHMCKVCDQTYSTDKRLKQHIQTVHLGEPKLFVCHYCGKGFRTACYLRNHTRTHTQETPFKCQYCDRSFSFKWACKTHEHLHTGVKPYKCSFCEETFTQNCVRKNHEFRAHGNEEFNPKNRKPREGYRRERKKKVTSVFEQSNRNATVPVLAQVERKDDVAAALVKEELLVVAKICRHE